MDRISPFYRLLVFIMLVAGLLLADGILSNLIIICSIVLLIAMSSISRKGLFLPVYKLRHFLLLIFLLNALFSDEGTLFEFFIFRVSLSGILRALLIVYRMALITLIAYLYTSSSTINEINESLYILLYPLKLLFVPVDMLSSALSLSLRLIDDFLLESERLKKVRQLRMIGKSDTLKEKILDYKAIVIPIFIMAFKRADELSLSLESRGYSAKMRLRRDYLKLGTKELISVLLAITILVFMISGGII